MSDEFGKSSLRFKQEITVSEPEICYSAKATSPDIIFAMDIPFPLLKDWHRIRVSSPDKQTLTSGENLSTGSEDEQASLGLSAPQRRRKIDFVDLLEYSIPCGLFAFTDDEAITDEISSHLSNLAGTVVQLYKKTEGRARKELNEKVQIFQVLKGHVKSVRELYKEIEYMRDEIQEWKAMHKDLEE